MTNKPTDAEIIALADETRTGEPGREGYILPISFARAVLAKWGQPTHSGEPVAWLNPWRADQVTTDYDAYGERGIPPYTAPQLTPVEQDYEHQRAIMEGERNASLDAYSRVVPITSAESRLYERAFTSGWDRRDRLASYGQAPAQPAPAAVAGTSLQHIHDLLYTAQRTTGDAQAQAIAEARIALSDLMTAPEPVLATRAWPKVSGVSRDEGHPQALLVFFSAEPTDDEMRAVHGTLAAALTTQPTPQQEPSYTSAQLAEMVLSDCGHSSNYTPLLNRVAARIDAHVERCLESKKTTQQEAQEGGIKGGQHGTE